MGSYLLAWNPVHFTWDTLDKDFATYQAKGFLTESWSSGVTKRIVHGDRVYLMRLGPEPPRGIMASGTAQSPPYEGTHYKDPTKRALYVDVLWDIMLHPDRDEILPRSVLEKQMPSVHWSPQASGTQIDPEAAIKLKKLWKTHVEARGFSPLDLAEEVVAPEKYWEGATVRVSMDAFERNPQARKCCIEHYGTKCIVCGFDFSEVFGSIGEGYIHVHHLKPLSRIRESHVLDPVADLVPVCPNCHAMLHRKDPPYTIERLKRFLLRK
jgi:5-methylcytosine-specific restriction protein A